LAELAEIVALAPRDETADRIKTSRTSILVTDSAAEASARLRVTGPPAPGTNAGATIAGGGAAMSAA
jgi:hypothetical protein